MSIVEAGNAPLDPKRVRWAGYGLMAAGILAVVVSSVWRGPVTAGIAIVITLLPVMIALYAPQAFEVVNRGKRAFNPLVGASAVVLFFNAVGLDLVEVAPGWIAAGVGAAVAAIAGFVATRRQPVAGPMLLVIYMLFIGGAYGYGAFNVADVRFDSAPATDYRATVDRMSESHGRSTTYTVYLAPWGPLTSSSSVTVSSSVYKVLNPGDTACMTLHPGRFGVRWFTLALCQDAKPQ